jgi:hypothetical protein
MCCVVLINKLDVAALLVVELSLIICSDVDLI